MCYLVHTTISHITWLNHSSTLHFSYRNPGGQGDHAQSANGTFIVLSLTCLRQLSVCSLTSLKHPNYHHLTSLRSLRHPRRKLLAPQVQNSTMQYKSLPVPGRSLACFRKPGHVVLQVAFSMPPTKTCAVAFQKLVA